jgi:hypothetical protein
MFFDSFAPLHLTFRAAFGSFSHGRPADWLRFPVNLTPMFLVFIILPEYKENEHRPNTDPIAESPSASFTAQLGYSFFRQVRMSEIAGINASTAISKWTS